jgi:hypothetical protein
LHYPDEADKARSRKGQGQDQTDPSQGLLGPLLIL